MDERKLFDGDKEFRRGIELEKLRQKKQARKRGIEQQIAEAAARGDFDDLPGKGKPLNWESSRDDESWLAHHVLKNAGFTPGWIEDGKHIQSERKQLAEQLDAIERWLRAARAETDGADGPPASQAAIETGLRSRMSAWRERAEKLNKVIDRYNFEVPLLERQVLRLRIDADLARLEDLV